MNIATRKALMLVELILFLLPLTLFMLLLTAVSYVAYPIPLTPVQVAFDLGMLLKLAGIIAAWRLAILFLLSGRGGLSKAHRAWVVLLWMASLLGVLSAMVAIEQFILAPFPQPRVGFTLLAPALALGPICCHILWERHHP